MPPTTRGPLPAGVYWRRRAAVLGTIALLVIAFVDVVNGDDDKPAADETVSQSGARPTTAPTEQGGTAVGPTRKGHKKRKPRTTPTFTPPPAPEPPDPEGTCADSDVLVVPVMDDAITGRPVLVSLELRTSDAEACTWQLGRERLAYKITDADGDDVWSSSQCPGQVPADPVVVRRDFTTTYRLAWNGKRSSLDCPASMKQVPAGTYFVQAAAIGGEASPVVEFAIQDPVVREPLGPAVPETDKKQKQDR